MALIDQYDLAHLPNFIKRVQVAIIAAAIDIQAEDESNLTAPAGFATAGEAADATKQRLHDLRSKLAYRVLNGPTSYAAIFAQGVATNATVAAAGEAATDNDIQFVVNSLWDAFAVGEGA